MTTPRLALMGFTAGAATAFGIMGALAARSAYAIHKGHRWGDIRRIIGRQ